MSGEKKVKFVAGHTPRVVCAPWAKVFEADSYKGGEKTYKIKVIEDRAVLKGFLEQHAEVAAKALADARAALEEKFTSAKSGKDKGTAKEELAKLKAADLPFKPVYDDDGNETDKVIVQFKSPYQYKDKKTGKVELFSRPKVVDRHGKRVTRPVQLGEGSIVIVAYELRPFYKPAVGAGASLRLTGLQIIKAVPYGSGSGPEFAEQDGEDIDYDALGFTPQSEDAPAEAPAGAEAEEADAF